MAADGAAPPEAQQIEDRLLRFIQGELLGPGTTLDRHDDLLSGELLDSVAVLRLATFVGEEFDFEIRPADFVVENFQSVAVIAEYVLRATREAG